MTNDQKTKIMELVERINDSQVAVNTASNDLMEKRIDLLTYLEKQVKESL